MRSVVQNIMVSQCHNNMNWLKKFELTNDMLHAIFCAEHHGIVMSYTSSKASIWMYYRSNGKAREGLWPNMNQYENSIYVLN